MTQHNIYITKEDIERVRNSDMSLSHKGSNFSPSLNKKNRYVKTVEKADRLLKILGYN